MTPSDLRIPADRIGTLEAPAGQALRLPTDVAVDSNGRIYVADGVNDRVVRFRADGTLDRVLTAPGGEPLHGPVGVTVDAADQVWIADTGNRRVVVIAPDGALVESIKLPSAETGDPTDPTDVLVVPETNRVYVVDNDNHRILIRDGTTGRWESVGSLGEKPGQFQWPFLICMGPAGNVLVSDVLGGRVQQLGPGGTCGDPIGQWGVEPGQFHRPKGVAVDSRGRIFVSDSTLAVVQVFSSKGHLAGVLTNEAGEPVRFAHPMGMCFDANGRLYVVELKANRVAVLDVKGSSASAGKKPRAEDSR